MAVIGIPARAVVASFALVCALVCALASAALAEPTRAEVLRDGNAAAAQGDWPRVTALVDPLLRGQLPAADLAEAHRLAGIAAYFQDRRTDADAHFLAYLRIELDARLDPALYPPDLVLAFENVRSLHAAELRARRPKPRRYWLLNLLPPGGQIQNGDRTKAYVFGGLLGAFAISNVTSYLVLRSWCTQVSGSGGPSATCDDGEDRAKSASSLRALNIVSGIGLILTYGIGVYDGVSGYRRRESMQPFVAPTTGGSVVGVTGSF